MVSLLLSVDVGYVRGRFAVWRVCLTSLLAMSYKVLEVLNGAHLGGVQ